MVEPNQDLSQIEVAISSAMDFPVHDLSSEELVERSRRIQTIKVRVAALSARSANRVMSTDSASTVRSTVGRLAAATGHDPKGVRQELKTERWLTDFSVFSEAFAAGRLSLAHLQILRGLDSVTTRHQLIEDQRFLAQEATKLTFVEFRAVATYWANAADPDGEKPLYAEARSDCSYRRNSDGSITGKFFLDAVSAGAFKTAFETRRQNLFRAESEEGMHRSQWQLGAATCSRWWGRRTNPAAGIQLTVSSL